jgi:hypothetical protein
LLPGGQRIHFFHLLMITPPKSRSPRHEAENRKISGFASRR